MPAKRFITAGVIASVFLVGFGACILWLKAPAVKRTADLWNAYDAALRDARYIDLTHAFAPGQPRGALLNDMSVMAARAAETVPGLINRGDAFSYSKHGVGITSYIFGSDQVGTQLDPPAHWNALGATISDLPPTYAVRPLVVINIAGKVHKNPAYHASVADILNWEEQHGQIPAGSVVMIRSDWSKFWNNPAKFASAQHPGVSLAALKLLHLDRHILFHGHEPLDTDTTPDFAGERWLLGHNFAQAEGVMNLDQVPDVGALIVIGFAKPLGGTGGLARFVAIAPADWPYGVTIDSMPGAPLPHQKAPLDRGQDGVLRPTTPAG
jgi:kynurenine formamidase